MSKTIEEAAADYAGEFVKKHNLYNPELLQNQSLTLPCKIVRISSKELKRLYQGYWQTNSKEKMNDLEKF